MVSQPVPGIVSVMVPAAVKICPPKVYGNSLAQTERLTVEVSNGSSVTLIVLIVSQPIRGIVSMMVPAALKICPPKVYGNSLAQTERLTVEVSNGSSVTLIVLIVSQPVPGIVSVMVPAAVKICPPKVYGNSLAQTERLTVEVSNGSSVTLIVLIVSQPIRGIVSMMVPAALKICPPKVYGNSLAQTERLTVEVSNGSSVTLIVLIVSQPVPGIVSVMVPAALKICPPKVYGNSLAQTERLTVVVSNGSSVTLIVLMVSQPVPGIVSVMVPAALKICPPKVYGNSLAQTERLTVVVSNGSSVTLIVLMVSQSVPGIVSVMVPAALKICPPKVYGNSLAQTERLTVVVSNGSSVTLIVLKVSQPPVVEATVSVREPTPLNTCPPKV